MIPSPASRSIINVIFPHQCLFLISFFYLSVLSYLATFKFCPFFSCFMDFLFSLLVIKKFDSVGFLEQIDHSQNAKLR